MKSATGFVDLHVHLLAGLDDGPARMEDALALCRALVEQGVRQAAATCHQGGAFSINRADAIREGVRELQRAIDLAKIPLVCHPSAEWMLDSEAVEHLAERLSEWLTIADNGRYALIEFPFQFPGYSKIVGEIFRQNKIRPVLAHAERFPSLAANPARLRSLRHDGYVIQVNADSIAGSSSGTLVRVCRRWIRSGLVDVVASDAHSLDQRPPFLLAAYELVARWTNPATAQLLFADNPRAIVEGGEIVPAQHTSWLERWHRR